MNGAAAQQRIHAPAGQRFPKHRNTGFLNAGTAVSKLPDWRFPGAGILRESRCCCRNVEDDVPYTEILRIRRTWCLSLVLLPGRRDAAPYIEILRIRPGFPVSDRMLRGKGKPFPYNTGMGLALPILFDSDYVKKGALLLATRPFFLPPPVGGGAGKSFRRTVCTGRSRHGPGCRPCSGRRWWRWCPR